VQRAGESAQLNLGLRRGDKRMSREGEHGERESRGAARGVYMKRSLGVTVVEWQGGSRPVWVAEWQGGRVAGWHDIYICKYPPSPLKLYKNPLAVVPARAPPLPVRTTPPSTRGSCPGSTPLGPAPPISEHPTSLVCVLVRL
jgi:hypothetical protein